MITDYRLPINGLMVIGYGKMCVIEVFSALLHS